MIILVPKKTKLAGLSNYTLPNASASTVGGVKVGSNLSITADGTLSADLNYNNIVGVPGIASTLQNGFMSYEDKAKLDSFGAASTYALKSDITNMYKYKGSVSVYANLPASGMTVGDVYNVESNGQNYAWDGEKWDSLGEIFTINSITNAEIDTITV